MVPSPPQDSPQQVPAPASPPASASDRPPQAAAPDPAFPVGAQVRLRDRPRYLRSADPMPMLRPPDLIDAEECGLVVELRPLDQRAVRFRRGIFLLDARQLQAVP